MLAIDSWKLGSQEELAWQLTLGNDEKVPGQEMVWILQQRCFISWDLDRGMDCKIISIEVWWKFLGVQSPKTINQVALVSFCDKSTEWWDRNTSFDNLVPMNLIVVEVGIFYSQECTGWHGRAATTDGSSLPKIDRQVYSMNHEHFAAWAVWEINIILAINPESAMMVCLMARIAQCKRDSLLVPAKWPSAWHCLTFCMTLFVEEFKLPLVRHNIDLDAQNICCNSDLPGQQCS